MKDFLQVIYSLCRIILYSEVDETLESPETNLQIYTGVLAVTSLTGGHAAFIETFHR